MSKKSAAPKRKQMPKHVNMRVGIKVCWYYYKPEDKEVIEEAVKVARHNAKIDEEAGYDFGYCSPGSQRLCKEGEYAGLVEVCVS